VLKGLQPDTIYTVTLVPVYAEGDGKSMSENGKTSKTVRRSLGVFDETCLRGPVCEMLVFPQGLSAAGRTSRW